jgi:hypothetical protein
VFQTLSALLDIAPASAALTLLHQISNFLHLVLHRYSISVEQIRKLVPVSIRVARRQQTENTVATVLFEMCISVLKGQPVTPGTLNMLLTWLGDEDDPNLKSEKLSLLAQASPGCATILCRQHPTLRALRDPSLRDPELTMSILKAAATVIIRGELDSPGNTGRVLRGLPNESASTQLDVFSHLLFASLDVCLGDSRSRIMSLYPVLGRAASLALFACADLLALPDPRGDGAHLASAAFAVMRLAILAVNDPPPKDGAFEASNVEAHDVLLSFWHRLWPEWDRLMGLSLAPSCINLPQRAVTLSVLMDIILFISANQPALLVEPAPTLSRGLDSLTEWHQNAGTQVPAKIHKAAAALDATALRSQPAANARRLAVAAVWPDMVATERLQSLRTLHR